MVELKLEALFCVPFDQMVNPRDLACCGRESECRFLCWLLLEIVTCWLIEWWTHGHIVKLNRIVLHIGIKLHCLTVCYMFLVFKWGFKVLLNFCNVFVICRKVRAVLMTKILWFWLFSVLSHRSWIKIFFLSLDRTLRHGFKVPWFRLVCTSVEFVLSIVIKSVVNYIICTNVESVLSIVIKWFKF